MHMGIGFNIVYTHTKKKVQPNKRVGSIKLLNLSFFPPKLLKYNLIDKKIYN